MTGVYGSIASLVLRYHPCRCCRQTAGIVTHDDAAEYLSFGLEPLWLRVDCRELHAYLPWGCCRMSNCALAALEQASAATGSKRIDLPLNSDGVQGTHSFESSGQTDTVAL
jgi:hypothetical protein